MNDIAFNKVQSIQRFTRGAREEYAAEPDGFEENVTRQDAAVLNILRACQQSIDLANHVIKTEKLGIPTSSGESFALLQAAGVIDTALSARLLEMVGFRNAIIHHDQRMDVEGIRTVIATGLDDLILFGERVLNFLEKREA